jgi:hypothetical protein
MILLIRLIVTDIIVKILKILSVIHPKNYEKYEEYTFSMPVDGVFAASGYAERMAPMMKKEAQRIIITIIPIKIFLAIR